MCALPATDNFNRDNENPLAGNWTTIANMTNMALYLNKVYPTGYADAETGVRWNADAFNDNQYSQAKLIDAKASNQWSQKVTARTSASAKTFYDFGSDDGANFLFQKCVAGDWTQLGAAVSLAPQTNDVIKITASGTTIEGFVNGVSQGTRVDSSISSGSAGFIIYYGTSSFDDWEGGNVAAGGLSIPVVTETLNFAEALD
jgi:hypothetical protein